MNAPNWHSSASQCTALAHRQWGLEGIALNLGHKKRRASGSPLLVVTNQRLDSNDVLCLQAFLTLSHSERYFLAFDKSLEAVTNDSAEVSEDIGARLLLDEAKAFRFVEPLNRSSSSRHNNFLFKQKFHALARQPNRSGYARSDAIDV